MSKNPVRAVFGFIYKSAKVVATTALKIGTSIKKNELLFPSVSPKADDGLVIINDLIDANKNNDGSPVARAVVKEKLATTQSLMRNWAPQVTKDAKGSLEILLKSGFENAKQPQANPAVSTPLIVKIKDTANSGTIKISTPVVKYADKFQYRFTTEINPVEKDFVQLLPGVRAQTVTGLIPATTYYLSCRAFGTHSVSDWCDPFAWIVR